MQRGKHLKHGFIYALSLSELSLNCKNFCSKSTHYLNTILTNLRGEDLVSRFLTADKIFEFSQYDFDMDKMRFFQTLQTSKHWKQKKRYYWPRFYFKPIQK